MLLKSNREGYRINCLVNGLFDRHNFDNYACHVTLLTINIFLHLKQIVVSVWDLEWKCWSGLAL